ncbi:MAG TPA: peptide-methionine (S)-S-oxide reductase MsrA [Candidatus Bathyarchaeia archaeon]|nr:peptide-methionine (S)-S-oxide reductase MsrA [Candidatus Bathyarchaeia archaeon]
MVVDAQSNLRLEKATIGGGCFWCTEATFEQIEGVEKVESGYAGGNLPKPTYEQVCSGTTGHAEVVQITFNPEKISFREILEIFFAMHDPTTLNRQGADVGTQYRSVIFYHDHEQKRIAEQIIKENQAKTSKKIMTEVVPYEVFYKAEDYHQSYYQQNSRQPYCQVVIAPKMIKLRQHYQNRLKVSQPVAE